MSCYIRTIQADIIPVPVLLLTNIVKLHTSQPHIISDQIIVVV